MQATVDDECRFTSFKLGWPGCVTDNKIFKYSHLWQHWHQYFKNGEYILVDKGAVHWYQKDYVIYPPHGLYGHLMNQKLGQPMQQFNRRLLSEMGHHADVQEMCKVIEALLILHNICIDFGDALESIFDFNPKDDFPLQDLTTVNLGYIAVDGDAVIPPYETDQWIREAGRRKRELIFNDLFPAL
ncbi:hypothetical protein HHX47_DHR2000723 [Lentinula edodes]|nr:hypothetical protein HHX47_DHR2000723 [Lentinula edodes]